MASLVETKLDERLQQLEVGFGSRVCKLEENFNKAVEVQESVTTLQNSLQFHSDQLDDLAKVAIPALTSHFEKVATALAMQTLEIDVHRRKWSLIVHGIKGAAREDEAATRQKVIDMAQQKLKVTAAAPSDLGACHRLKAADDAGIIVRFNDLSKRNQRLAGAKFLKGLNISMSVDLPPCLRPCKQELMDIRKDLSPEDKKHSFMRHLPSWPFVELNVHNGTRPVQHTIPKASVVQNALDMDGPIKFNLREVSNTS